MRQLRLFTAITAVSGMMFFSSCNSNDDKSTTEPGKDTTATKTETPTNQTPTATTQNVLRITHKVANYAKWKMAYDAHDSARQAMGIHNYVIARGVEDSNMVMVAMKVDDPQKAKQFSSSPDVKERMKQGGVVGPVQADVLTTVMSDTTGLLQSIRLAVHHKVKDWDAWKKVFDSDKQARIDAGLTDRVLSHAVDDTHDVFIVFSVADMAKAKAFISSKTLKDKMTEGGVEGQPTFWFYRAVQKY